MIDSIKKILAASPYQSYIYSYPHKSAYRELKPRPLGELWQEESREKLFLYIHIPFCESKCGFCNLFSQANPEEDLMERYLEALERQAEHTLDELGPLHFSRFAIGGGTPTLLPAAGLERLFKLAVDKMGIDLEATPCSVECSPVTATNERLDLLKEYKVDRISMGVQSFIAAETEAVFRRQRIERLEESISRIKGYNFPILNLDLIYGIPGQSLESWRYSLERALSYEPEELYLYPLYIRPLTGLERSGAGQEDDIRLKLYREGCRILAEAGYRRESMRRFIREGSGISKEIGEYSCQEDGMIGLGCGARSYTKGLHYSEEYAVGGKRSREIIESYIERESFSSAAYGIALNLDEQRRRYLLKSLLHYEGLSRERYRQLYGSQAERDFPQLEGLIAEGLAVSKGEAILLTALGLDYSDSIGELFISGAVRERMEGFKLL